MRVCFENLPSCRLTHPLDHVEVIKYLVSVGADKTVKGPDGNTALEAAINQDVKELLL